MLISVCDFLQNTLSTNAKGDFFLQMNYFDFAEISEGLRFLSDICFCEMETNISAYLNADYFLQMIYFDFAER